MDFLAGLPSAARIWRCRFLLGQRDKLVVVEIRQLHAAGQPVRFCLLEPLRRRRDKIPVQKPLAQGFAASSMTIDGSSADNLSRPGPMIAISPAAQRCPSTSAAPAAT